MAERRGRGTSGRTGRGSRDSGRLPWEDPAPWDEPERPSRGAAKTRGGTSSARRGTAARGRKASSSGRGRVVRGKAGPRNRRPPGRGRRASRRLVRLARLGSPVRRLNAGLLVVVFILTLFAGRLMQLQGVDASQYAQMATKQRIRTKVLYAERGELTDRSGTPLALSVDAQDIYVDPTKVPAVAGRTAGGVHVPSKQEAAQRLAAILRQPEADLLAKLNSTKRFVYIAKQVAPMQVHQIQALGIPTLGADPDPKRVYPSGELAASTVGFVGANGNGLGGLELAQNNVLAGRNGKEVVQIGRAGQVIPSAAERIQAVVPGRDVRLTLDSEIQWEAQQALEAQVKATKAKSGTVVVMDPATGSLLALATAPGFDPGNLNSAGSIGLGNPAVQDVYEPGSTNKVITAAAALEHTDMEPTSAITVPGALRRYDKTFHDDVAHGTWHLTLGGVLAKSSNIGIDLVSEKIGKQQLYDSMRAFGFGERTGVGLPGESRGILPPPDKWSGTQRYTIPFGQGVSVNAVQMASVYSTIANDGVRVQPNVVAGGTPESRRVISAHTAEQMREMLEGVTSKYGTAPEALISGYRVAGKTGTAQRVDPRCGCYRGYTASFVGMAPAEQPKLVVEVVLQDPKKGHFGGQVAAPVFHQVMSFALRHEKVPPSTAGRPKLRIWAK
jgi:cell division protein FtsI (penicillin-binding protein 3)